MSIIGEIRKRAPVVVNPVNKNIYENRIKLSSEWRFKLDPEDKGIREKWYNHPLVMSDSISVPGSWQGQGYGSDEKDILRDFQLCARTFQASYTGTGWYSKEFSIPQQWKGKHIWINFGGVYPSAVVWLNGIKLGEHHAPFVPFGFDITNVVKFSEKNILVVQVNEQSRLFGFAYNWQGNWSGLYRDVEITATGDNYLDEFRVHANVDKKAIDFTVKIGECGTFNKSLHLEVSIGTNLESDNYNTEKAIEVEINEKLSEFTIPIEFPKLWSPDTPNLYRVDAVLKCNNEVLDAFSDRIGFVKLSTKGKHFLINDEPYYMKGTGDFLSCPETGCPDTDRNRWRKKLKALKDYGYNYVRCQSYVYGPEYYDVADEVGLIIQSEMGMLGAWGGHSIWHIYPWPQPTPDYRKQLKWQWDCTVLRDVNHPSATIYCMSNEWFIYKNEAPYLNIAWKCYYDTKKIKPNSMVIWTDGGHNENFPEDFINYEAEFDNKCEKPLIQHEYRWWSSLPDVRIMHKYKGAIRPYAAEIALLAAARHGISHTLEEGAINSQKLQFIEAKGKMERCRRDNPTLAGINHFNAMDGNPSPQGIIDEFYELKYIDAKTWLQTNGDTVLLSSLNFSDRVYVGGDLLKTTINISDFSHPSLLQPELHWKFSVDGKEIETGTLKYTHKPFCTCEAGNVECKIPFIENPKKARLEVVLVENERIFTNNWSLWIYPNKVNIASNIGIYGVIKHTWIKTVQDIFHYESNLNTADVKAIVSETLDEKLVDYIKSGGRVILAANECLVRPFAPLFGNKEGHYYFTPPANYHPYEDGHDGTIIKNHPILAGIPNEGFADLNFYRLITDAAPLDLEPLGLNMADPVIRVMHKYPSGRSLGYITECRFGKGGLLICALNLDWQWPEARYLLKNICEYVTGANFEPEMTIDDESLTNIKEATLFIVT